jgi:hypothetical protein
VLVASAYIASAWGLDPRTHECYMQPMLDEAVALERLGVPVELRWRPHPADEPGRVARLRARYPQLQAASRTFEEDIAWAHVLVASVSSVILEALFYGVPVFVHDVPRWAEAMMEPFDDLRRFGHLHRLADLLPPVVTGLRAGDPKTLEPEARARVALFGPGERPRSYGDLVVTDRARTESTSPRPRRTGLA